MIVGEGPSWESVVVMTNLNQELGVAKAGCQQNEVVWREQNWSCNFGKIRDYVWLGFVPFFPLVGWPLFPFCSLNSCSSKSIDQSCSGLTCSEPGQWVSPGCSRYFWFYREQELLSSQHACVCSFPLPSSLGMSLRLETHLVSGSTLLVAEVKQNKPQGSHKQGFRSSHAEDPAAKQCVQPWSQVHLFYDVSMMVCRTPQTQKCHLSLWFFSGAIALAFWDVWMLAGRISSMEQAVRQC